MTFRKAGPAIVLLIALLGAVGLAGCAGGDDPGTPFDFNGTWNLHLTVSDSWGEGARAVGSTRDLFVRITQQDNALSLSFTLDGGAVVLSGSLGADGNSFTAGFVHPEASLQIQGTALDEDTMTGTAVERDVAGAAGASYDWTGTLMQR